jgi:cleavage and polyadenylation specificity factor subunit 1
MVISDKTSLQLGKYETIMSMKQVDLQISEESKRRRPFLVIGTATLRGEDSGTKGTLYVFDISQVVPQPNRPYTNRKLRLAWSEEVRGAVTVINEIRGYLLSSQGQKVMIRAFGEVDKEFLPVAFYDLSMVVTVAQSIRDFVLFGDIMHSICFIGFQEEPYRMTLLGKDYEKMEVTCGDFIVEGDGLFFAVADGQENIHVFQYDPESIIHLVLGGEGEVNGRSAIVIRESTYSTG